MKKIITTAFILSAAFSGFAQGFYFRLGAGYAFPQAGQTMYDSPVPYNGFPIGYNGTRNNTTTTETYNIKGASFSAGFQGSLGLGYMINNNVGIQLDGNIGLSAKKYTFNDENAIINYTTGPAASNISTIQQAQTPLIMIPALVLQSGGDKVNIYSRFGLALPLSSKITQDQVITSGAGTSSLTVDDFTWSIKSSFSLGFSAAAGLKYNISDKVSIWGEVSILSMTLNTKEQDLNNWTENGQTVPLSNYNGAQQITFSKTATFDSTYSHMPTYSQPFSNIGINVGVCFNLGNYSNSQGRRHNEDIDDTGTKPFRRR